MYTSFNMVWDTTQEHKATSWKTSSHLRDTRVHLREMLHSFRRKWGMIGTWTKAKNCRTPQTKWLLLRTSFYKLLSNLSNHIEWICNCNRHPRSCNISSLSLCTVLAGMNLYQILRLESIAYYLCWIVCSYPDMWLSFHSSHSVRKLLTWCIHCIEIVFTYRTHS